jgi:hypothetical protein
MPKYEGKPTESEKSIKAKQSIQKDKKKPKNEDLCCSSCHDGGYLLAKTTTEENLENICSSCYDASHRGTMSLLDDQADEMHMISYNFKLYLPIVSRWT